jgi:hypothetical protein
MAKMTKAPTVNIKAPPAPKAPPPNFSKTQDNFSHHTSPSKGPQAVDQSVNAVSSAPRVKLRTLPDTPKAKYKHDD